MNESERLEGGKEENHKELGCWVYEDKKNDEPWKMIL